MEKSRPATENTPKATQTILVAEDDEGLSYLIKRNLERAGFQAICVAEGAKVIEKIAGNSGNLLLLDYQLPDMTAREVVEKLNQMQRRIPFVVMTGHGDERIAMEMMKLGARDYLVKDASFIHLLPEVVRRVIRQLDTEKELAETEELFRTLFSSSPIGTYIVQHGKFQLANPQFQELTGYSGDELRGINSLSLVLPHDRSVVREDAVKMLKGERIPTHEFRLVTKEGEIKWVMEKITSIQYQGGRATLGALIDITERKRAEEAARELDRLKSEFIAKTSHELRTPLFSIRGFTKLLLRDKVPDAQTQKEFLALIDENSERLSNLVNDVLDVSVIESGRMRIEKQPVSVKGIIQRVLKNLDGMAKERHLSLETETPETLPEALGDERRLEQVVTNLAGNAIKFSNENGQITVRGQVEGNELMIQVVDHGIGIPADAIPHLFSKFYQVNGSATRTTSGTGLGLYIARQIVEAHGGRIWVESKAGQGSTFTFTVPVAGTLVESTVDSSLGGKTNG